jgi:hypothetical protein
MHELLNNFFQQVIVYYDIAMPTTQYRPKNHIGSILRRPTPQQIWDTVYQIMLLITDSSERKCGLENSV